MPSLISRALVLLLFASATSGAAQGQEGFIDREPKIKAAYLYQFIRYTQWPNSAFAGADSPLVIGAIGKDPVNPFLKQIAAKRKAGNRKLVFRVIEKAEQAKGCHLIFVSDKADKEVADAALKLVEKQPVLLVGETENFAQSKGVLEFHVVSNKVKLKLSLAAAQKRGLKISSQLAKLTEIVDKKPAGK